MSMVSQLEAGVATAAKQTNEAKGTDKKYKVNGKTIGEPRLSEKAQKYYEELKKKYSNMDFILVSTDKKEQAQAQAGQYANAFKMVVLIDEEKIERMAEDESYRKQYEGVIQKAAGSMAQLKSSLSSTSANVKGYGIKVNDNGTASFFAVIDQSLADQRKRIEKKGEEKKAEKKAADKKAAEKAKEKEKQENLTNHGDDKDTITVTASSIEELINKINDIVLAGLSDNIQTDEEKQIGQNFDFRL